MLIDLLDQSIIAMKEIYELEKSSNDVQKQEKNDRSTAFTILGFFGMLPAARCAGDFRVSKKWRCRRHCCHSIVAGTTAVVPARFVSHLRVANRLRRLCPLGTRFPPVPAGVIGAAPLTLVPQHISRKPA